MTNLERYQALTQLYVGRKEIMRILGTVDPNRASAVITAITTRARQEGKKLLYERGRVPSKMLIEYLDIDLDEVYQNALKEKQLGICP